MNHTSASINHFVQFGNHNKCSRAMTSWCVSQQSSSTIFNIIQPTQSSTAESNTAQQNNPQQITTATQDPSAASSQEVSAGNRFTSGENVTQSALAMITFLRRFKLPLIWKSEKKFARSQRIHNFFHMTHHNHEIATTSPGE